MSAKGGIRVAVMGRAEGRGLLWDADVDGVFMSRGIRVGTRTTVSLGEYRLGWDAAGRAVEAVERGPGVGREQAGVDAPVDDFGVGVSERTGPSHGGGRVEGVRAVGAEGRQRRVDVLDGAGRGGERAVRVGTRRRCRSRGGWLARWRRAGRRWRGAARRWDRSLRAA